MTRTVLLGDVAEVLGGGTPSTKIAHYWEGDIPWITPRDLSTHHNVYISNGERHITESGLNNSSAKLLPKGAVIFSSRAPIGYVVIASQPMTTNQGCKGIICDESKIHNRFLYYWLKCNKQHIESRASGSTFKEISTSEMRNLAMDIPGIETQKKIADILGTIDEKIELNRKMNETLEQIGQALFRHYFIDNPEAKNWEIAKLKDIVENIKQPLKPGKHLSGRIYLPIERLQMKNLSVLNPLDYSEAKSSLISFEKNDILVGAMRVYFHRVNIAPSPGVTRTTTFVLRPKKEHMQAYATFLLHQASTIAYANTRSKGTTMPYAIWDNGLGDMLIKLPPEERLHEYQKHVWPMIEIIRDSYVQIQTLTTLRDTLLPRLISGKIKI